jgi:glucose/arabinose dehydrogenase
MNGYAKIAGLVIAMGLAITGCSSVQGARSPGSETAAAATSGVEPVGSPKVIASGLKLPWSMVRLSSGSTLISERDTALVRELQPNGKLRTVTKIKTVVPGGEGGLLGLAVVHGKYLWLYAYTSTANDNRVIRMHLTGKPGSYKVGAAQVVFKGIQRGQIHNGGRIKFGPDGMLYITAGESGDRPLAQDKTVRAGKIFRVKPNGATPKDNPFHTAVWTYGHRNPQGIAWDSTGRMWASELGQDTWDELNIITKGSNYGWPTVEGDANNASFVDPVAQWSTADASPSGLLYAHGTLFMAALRGERLWVIHPGTGATVTVKDYFNGDYGRLRDVIAGPNNTIWVATSNTGRSPKPGDDKILQFKLASID